MSRASLLKLYLFSAAAAHAGELRSSFTVNGSSTARMQAGRSARWEFDFRDSETNAVPHHFHVMHAKPMHLVLMSEDLSHFAHVHPTYNEHAGHGHGKPFSLNINATTSDPDNFQVPTAVPFAGKYFLYGEVMAMGYDMLLFPYDLEATGRARATQPIESDARNNEGNIVKLFDANGGAVSDPIAAFYQLQLNVESLEHCGVILPKLNIELRNKATDSSFQALTDLDMWLESYGHAIVAGRAGASAKDKIVQHLHAVWPLPTGNPAQDERGPYLELAAHSHGKSTPTDRYRSWVQIKHRGRVLTLPFTFDWDLPSATANARPSQTKCVR